MSLTKVSYSMVAGAPVNILDYGAIPNDVSKAAINSVAIQAAINTGSQVTIPIGTFYYDTTLILVDNVAIIGENKVTSILQYTSTGNGIAGQVGVRLFRMLLTTFTLTASNTGNAGTGIYLTEYDSYHRIEEVQTYGWGNGGIWITGLHNTVRKCNVNGKSLANGGSTFGIRVSQSITTSLVATTIVLDQNYISSVNRAGLAGIGIEWLNVYKCSGINNIIEVCDTGLSVSGSLITSSVDYYEDNTVSQLWVNSFGYCLGYANPNTTATWSNPCQPPWATSPISVSYQHITFQNIQAANNPLGEGSLYGPAKFIGQVTMDVGYSQGYKDFGDSNITYDDTYPLVIGVAPQTTRNYVLPKASLYKGLTLTVKKYNATAAGKTFALVPFSGDTVENGSSYVLANLNEFVTIISDGVTDWKIISAGNH